MIIEYPIDPSPTISPPKSSLIPNDSRTNRNQRRKIRVKGQKRTRRRKAQITNNQPPQKN
ncbi:hypothetical protein BpHYR1_052009 [Brachionus plicatilis]|uniref:Uncharacterized protein n=1 Tax=Brachionus plicatilis TaxID=10195 RepID=A0A3M7SCB8_BRAPC|nr:hypothetical protein BpHYR1_052009 [Brachionus plicatilis]